MTLIAFAFGIPNMVLAWKAQDKERTGKEQTPYTRKWAVGMLLILCGFVFVIIGVVGENSAVTVGVILQVIAFALLFYLWKNKARLKDVKPTKRMSKDQIQDQRYESGSMSPEEARKYEKKQMRIAEILYNGGKLTFAQYIALKSKYEHDDSLINDLGGLGTLMAYSDKIQADKAVQKQKKQNENGVIFGAAIGNVVGGAIVGATSAAVEGAKQGAELAGAQAAAEAKYQAALKNSVK